MNLANLKKLKSKRVKRVGRGISAGQGKTAGRGTKGQNSRTGGGTRPGFEGGQMPLAQRVPKKRGFTSRTKKSVAVSLSRLSVFSSGEEVSQDSLAKKGIIKDAKTMAKIVGPGGIKTKLIVSIPVSKKAGEAILAAGGKLDK